MKYILIIMVLIQLGLQIFIDRQSTFISDPLLKAIQGHSLFANEFHSEEIVYPGKWADPNYTSYLFNGGFTKFVNDKYIGQYPIFFSVYSGILLKIGIWSIPVFAILLLIGSFYFLHRALKIPILFCLLYFLSSIINNTYNDLNEGPLFFFFCALGFSYLIYFLKEQRNLHLFLGLFSLAISVWLRLESILFIFSCLTALSIILFKEKKISPVKQILVIILALTPLYLFFIWNLVSYGHIMGTRFYFNFGSTTSFPERIIRIISMSLFYKDSTGIKFGLFFCSPYLLLSLIYYIRNFKNSDRISTFAFLAFAIQFIFVSVTAPNDGVTLTARYHVLGILPGIILSYNLFQATKTKVFKLLETLSYGFALIFGLFISIGWIFFAKEISNFQKIAFEQKPDVYIVKNDLLCASLGLKHLDTSIFCIRSEEQEKLILEQVFANPKINRVSYTIESKVNLDDKMEASLMSTFQENNYKFEKKNKYRIAHLFLFNKN